MNVSRRAWMASVRLFLWSFLTLLWMKKPIGTPCSSSNVCLAATCVSSSSDPLSSSSSKRGSILQGRAVSSRLMINVKLNKVSRVAAWGFIRYSLSNERLISMDDLILIHIIQ